MSHRTTGPVLISLLALVAAAVAAPAAAQKRSDRNQVIAVAYGTVIGIETIKLDSNAGKGAALGGLVGLAASGGSKKGKRALTGAAIGGVGTKVVEGSNEALEYTVRLVSGQDVKMIMDDTGMRLGDCVSVEQGKSGNLRRVSSAHCEAGDTAPSADHQSEANACAEAKGAIAAASTDAALDLAIKKARVLCED
jgi:outer membrane lipoprotein SlyB